MGIEDIRQPVEKAAAAFRTRFHNEVRTLAKSAAEASNAFALAPTRDFLALNESFLGAIDDHYEALLTDIPTEPHQRPSLKAALGLQAAYLAGAMETGFLARVIRERFEDGDWDEVEPVTEVLLDQFDRFPKRLATALVDWMDQLHSLQAPAPEPVSAPTAPKPGAPKPGTPRPGAPNPDTTRASSFSPRPLDAMVNLDPPTQMPKPVGKARLDVLLDWATAMGIRIKKVPEAPSEVWLDKLQEKLAVVADKRGFDDPFELEETAQGTEETMAFVLPASVEQIAERSARLDEMVGKAETAGLKLGKIPDNPTDEWLADLEAKLETAVTERRRKRKEEREKLAKQRKERLDRLERQAGELGIDLGKIPPFPTDEWIRRAQYRIASSMLPTADAGSTDTGRAERLTDLLSRAADAGLELEVPPDPDEVWLGWAESQVAQASHSQSDVAFAVGEDPDEIRQIPTLFFEEDTIQEQRWIVDQSRFTIGRARSNGVQISHDAQLSRQHCVLEATDDGWTVNDLRSTQGTKLNGKPVRTPTPIQPGDTITVGETNLVFRYT